MALYKDLPVQYSDHYTKTVLGSQFKKLCMHSMAAHILPENGKCSEIIGFYGIKKAP